MSHSTSITTNDRLELVSRPRAELIREAQEAAQAPRVPEPKPRYDRRIHKTPSLRRAAKAGEANGYGYAVVRKK